MSKNKLKYFTAKWCGPCRMFRPVINELKTEGYDIEILDVDDQQYEAIQYRIMSVPTLVFEKEGSVYQVQSGVMSRQSVIDTLNQA